MDKDKQKIKKNLTFIKKYIYYWSKYIFYRLIIIKMAITFDSKIKELQEKKSELDVSILESQREEYRKRIVELLTNPVQEWKGEEAYNEMRECYAKVKELDEKINQMPADAWKIVEELDAKIAKYEAGRKSVRELQLYRDTEEWISNSIWEDNVYKYAKETNNEELIRKLKDRTLTEEEYLTILEQILPESEYTRILSEEHAETRYSNLEKLYNDLFKENEGNSEWKTWEQNQPKVETTESKPTIELPEWMQEEIREMVNNSDEFECISADDVIRFMLKELKNNLWEIKDKHIRNKFKWLKEYKAAYNLILYLTKKYQEFSIIKQTAAKPTISAPSKTKNQKLVEEAIQSRSSEAEKDEIKNAKLIDLTRITKIADLNNRCREYINFRELIWWKFHKKEEFIGILENVIRTQTNIQFETLLKNLLKKIILTDFKPEQKQWEEYLTYDLWDWNSRRNIVIYPTWEIVDIVRHDDYLRQIRKKPPVGSRRAVKRR